MSAPGLSFAGRIARIFQSSPLTPVLALAALLLGLAAMAITPREEEPQIDVTMANVTVPFPGASVRDVENLVTFPLEQKLSELQGVKHVYSVSRPGVAVLTVEYAVGVPRQTAIVRLYNQIYQNRDFVPAGLGVGQPLVRAMGIDDVPVMALALWSDRPDTGPVQLAEVAHTLETELKRVPGTRDVYTVGAPERAVMVELDPGKLAAYGMAVGDLAGALKAANVVAQAGDQVAGNRAAPVTAGRFLASAGDVANLVIGLKDGAPVHLSDVASVQRGADLPASYAWFGSPAGKPGPATGDAPAVTIAIAKKAGSNAADITTAIRARLQALRNTEIPAGVHVAVTRDYGQTATAKADSLLLHLLLATLSVVLLVVLVLGWREGLVVGSAVIVTLALTLFASWAMGFTINRVSLFALIFSIGILVDDAIVVVENIARHWAMHDGRDRMTAAIEAVAEVGNPTIVATLTVVAALLPMLFVSGMMGPYMAPIPANASAAMLFSFFVAMVIAPWALLKISGKPRKRHRRAEHGEGRLGAFYRRLATPIVKDRKSARRFLAWVAAATVLVCLLFVTKNVTVKLLPFDNKSEMEVLVDLPEGATVEDTGRALLRAAAIVKQVPEVTSIQAYAGTPAPFNFNGLVRHYYLRQQPEMGELAVNLVDKADRSRESHAIALDLRRKLDTLDFTRGTVIKVVEVPPGPPVLSTLLAEIYGPDQKTRRAVAEETEKLFKQVPYIVDVDNSWGLPRPRLRISIDQDKLEYFGVEQSDVYDTLNALLGGQAVGYSHRGTDRDPLKIVVREAKSDLTWSQKLASTPVPANAQPGNKAVVELGDVVSVTEEKGSPVIFRRDGHYADMVTAELAGTFEAPLYGLMAVDKLIRRHDWGSLPPPTILMHGQPTDETRPSLLWDGEWEVTWVTFRDMGAAFGVAILGIYVLVVAQFKSFKLPLVILTPIPLTLIGIVLGHWLFGAPFTATSMIGFIALAGIIVRNSILLVDFIRHGATPGRTLREVLLDAGATRFRPIVLTALAAMIGAATILTDPIFQGLAISLLFGLASSTLLTVLVIPAIYVWLRDADRPVAPPRPSNP